MQGGHAVEHVPKGARRAAPDPGRPPAVVTHMPTQGPSVLSRVHTHVCRPTCQPVGGRVWGCPGDGTGLGWVALTLGTEEWAQQEGIARSRGRLSLPGRVSLPLVCSGTEHLLFLRPRGKLASRILSPTHDWNFPTVGMGMARDPW